MPNHIHRIIIITDDEELRAIRESPLLGETVSPAYKIKIPTNRLIGLWEFYVTVISPIRTARFLYVLLFTRPARYRVLHRFGVLQGDQ